MRAAHESHIAVVKWLLDFFLPPLFLSLPLGKQASLTKTKSFPPFSFYFNCDPYSFYCSLFVLIFFY